MTNVVTMSGDPLNTVESILTDIIARWKRGDITHIVAVLERADGLSEIAFNRQAHSQVVFAAAVLQNEALTLAGQAVVE